MHSSQYLYESLGKRRAILIETASMYGRSMGGHFERSFTNIGGNVIIRREVEEGHRNFGALIQMLPQDFDVLFYAGSFEGVHILRAMRDARLNQLFAAGDGSWDVKNFLEPAGEAAIAGEGVLVLSATPEVGQVPGSREFAQRYKQNYGPIGNYAVNSYDSARLLLTAIWGAASKGVPSRSDVVRAIRQTRFQGIAYRRPVEFDGKGDNKATVTALYTVEGKKFRQVAEVCSG